MGIEARRAVQAELLADLPKVAAAAVARVREVIPAYRDLHDRQLADTQAIGSWAITRVLGSWTGEAALDESDRARVRAIAAARAADGRPLTEVLRSYRVAAAFLIETIADAGRGLVDVEDMTALSVDILTGLDDLSEALMVGYTAARDRLSNDGQRARSDLLDDLLVGRQTSPGALAARIRELRLELVAHPTLILVEAAEPDAGLSSAELAEAVLDAQLASDGQPGVDRHLVTLRGPRGVLLVPPDVAAGVARVCSERHWRGCAIAGHATEDTVISYRLASDALDSAPPHAFHLRALLDEGDAQVLALLARRPGADPDRVVEAVLGALATATQRHILDGLAAYVTTGNAISAAKALDVHPQTLRYRVRRATELTGRDPHDPWQRLTLDIALQARHSH